MTDEMLALAQANRQRAGVRNAHFLRGQIEAIPLPDQAVDVVVSNCVINLSADKGAALREAYRVLRPGGRFRVADMVEVEPLPDALRSSLESWVGCIAGALPLEQYRDVLERAGFEDVTFEELQTYHGSDVGAPQLPGAVASMLVSASRPAAG
jgi:ubiquinone/menaquinone biosynthesis C-methylase UbiE